MKIVYQKPEIVDLTGMDALGQCEGGSNPGSNCSPGSFADAQCYNVGNGAAHYCVNNGSGAITSCFNGGGFNE